MAMSAKSYSSIIGANDRFRVAVAGVRGRGRSHISGFDEQDNVEVAYLVDPDRQVLDTRVGELRENGKNSKRVKGVTDIREVLDDKDIDAVSSATPNH
jgi:predicted dehydrogenase